MEKKKGIITRAERQRVSKGAQYETADDLKSAPAEQKKEVKKDRRKRKHEEK